MPHSHTRIVIGWALHFLTPATPVSGCVGREHRKFPDKAAGWFGKQTPVAGTEIEWLATRERELMLATICEDTWNELNKQHITPNKKDGIIQTFPLVPPTWLKVATTFETPIPTP